MPPPPQQKVFDVDELLKNLDDVDKNRPPSDIKENRQSSSPQNANPSFVQKLWEGMKNTPLGLGMLPTAHGVVPTQLSGGSVIKGANPLAQAAISLPGNGPAGAIMSGVGAAINPPGTLGELASQSATSAIPAGKLEGLMQSLSPLTKLGARGVLGALQPTAANAIQQTIDDGSPQTPSMGQAATGAGINMVAGSVGDKIAQGVAKAQNSPQTTFASTVQRIQAQAMKDIEAVRNGKIDQDIMGVKMQQIETKAKLDLLKAQRQNILDTTSANEPARAQQLDQLQKKVQRYTNQRASLDQDILIHTAAKQVAIDRDPNLGMIIKGNKELKTAAAISGIDYERTLGQRQLVQQALEDKVKSSVMGNPAIDRVLGDKLNSSKSNVFSRFFSAPTEDIKDIMSSVGRKTDVKEALRDNFLVEWMRQSYDPKLKRFDFEKMRQLVDTSKFRAVMGGSADMDGVEAYMSGINKWQTALESAKSKESTMSSLVQSLKEGWPTLAKTAFSVVGLTEAGLMFHSPWAKVGAGLFLLPFNQPVFNYLAKNPTVGPMFEKWVDSGASAQGLRMYPLVKDFLGSFSVRQGRQQLTPNPSQPDEPQEIGPKIKLK